MAKAQGDRTHCPRGHVYDEQNTTYSSGRRHCRACKSERYARTKPEPTIRPTMAERLWQRIEKQPNGCWHWTGHIGEYGYGDLGSGGGAHRLVYELVVGPIPDGLTLDHLCHTFNPTCTGGDTCLHRRCVNPSHMDPVPIVENVMRGQGFGAENARKTHCPAGHPYDAANTYINPAGNRLCRQCNRDKSRANYYARKVSR